MPEEPEEESTKGAGRSDAAAGFAETLDLVKRYVLQETVAELPRLGKRVGLAAAGALLVGTGFVILLLAVLRTLQTETGRAFAGNLSFAPFLITFAVAAVAIVLALTGGYRMYRRSGRRQNR